MSTDLDELLKLLEEQAEAKRTKVKVIKSSQKDSSQRFIDNKNIVKGLDRVPNYVIYYTYKKVYQGKMGEEKWSKHHFFRLFNKGFTQVRTGKQRYYKLDGKSFDLSRGGLLEAKKYDEEYKIEVKKARGTLSGRKQRSDKGKKRTPYRARKVSVPDEK